MLGLRQREEILALLVVVLAFFGAKKKEKKIRVGVNVRQRCFYWGIPCQDKFGGFPHSFGMEFGEGDATKQKSVKKSAVSLNGVRAFSE